MASLLHIVNIGRTKKDALQKEKVWMVAVFDPCNLIVNSVLFELSDGSGNTTYFLEHPCCELIAQKSDENSRKFQNFAKRLVGVSGGKKVALFESFDYADTILTQYRIDGYDDPTFWSIAN
jgi:hypothetical protein